jgi:hypothetical protein
MDELIPDETFTEDINDERKSLRPRKPQKNLKDDDDEEDSDSRPTQTNDDAEDYWCPSDEEDEELLCDDVEGEEPKFGRIKIRQSDQKKDRARFKKMEGEEGGSSKRKKRLHQCPFCPSSLQSALICEAHILRVHKGL